MSNHQLNPQNWVELYSDYLFNYTISRVNDRDLAKDLVQDTFFAGLKSMSNFKGEANERTWLISILKRKIIDYYRKKNSKKGKAEVRITYKDEENEGVWLEEQVSDNLNKNIEDAIVNEELADAIKNCMNKLPSKQLQVFKMKTIDGVDTETICNDLNITPSNLWVIIHRARTALAECLEKNWL